MPEPAFKRVEELFNRAVALPPDERRAFLDAACTGDGDLRAAVTAMLRHDAAETNIFGASPVAREANQARQYAPTLPAPAAATPSTPLPQIPGYELLSELGRGGMGVVYLARHTPLKRLVALKMLPATPATPEQLARFRLEAEALARLQHPNVVPIYDVGQFEGHPYFTMEYVAGPDLAALLDGRPQDVAASARLVAVLARAVQAVHECGIIHRDLKPGNILFGRETPASAAEAPAGVSRLNDFIPKITDFGLAKDRTSARPLTQTGDVMGTPCYMAPEQVRRTHHGVGPAADIYALGSILYELLTGRPPFDAATPVATIAQLLHQEPLSPSRLRPRLPTGVVTICLKCLEKSPRRRYASARDLADDLRRFQAGEPIHARPVGPVGHAYRWCLRRPLVAGLLALSAALTLAFVVAVVVYEVRLNEAELASAEARARAATALAEAGQRRIVQLNVTIGLKEMDDGDDSTALLRFAEALRLDAGDGVRERAHRVRIAAALRRCPRLVRTRADGGRVVCACLGPSGGSFATAGPDHALEVHDVLTGRTAGPRLRHDEVALDGTLSADGRWLATVGPGGSVRVWDVTTGKSQAVPDRGTDPIRQTAFTADGRALLTRHADSALRLWDLTGSEPALRWELPGSTLSYSALSEDARWLFTLDYDRVGQVRDVAGRKAVGPPLKLDQPVTLATISPDGGRLALIAPDGGLRVWDVRAGAWLPGTMRPRPVVRHVRFSPDGERIVTAGDDRRLQVWQVRTGEGLDMPQRDGAGVAYSRFSADGRLVVTGNDSGARVWDAATGQAVTPPLRQGSPLAAATFSDDARQVVTVSRGGTVRVWELPPAPEAAAAEPLPDERPVAVIVALAELLACARIDDNQQRQPLDERAFREAWEALHPAP